MNFTGSLVRSTFSFALTAVVMAWGLSLLTPRKTTTPDQVVGMAHVTGGEKQSALITHRAALRQLGKKQAVVAERALPDTATRLANHP